MKAASDKKTDRKIQELAQYLYVSRYPVFLTGAGISTESGLPDFRDPDGVRARRDKCLPPRPVAASWNSVEPNTGHYAIVELQKMGKLKFLISQDVDNLHLKSGVRPELLAELHGNMTKLRCTRCQQTVDQASAKSRCPCSGSLVSSVVDFGQSLPEKDLRLSFGHARKSDLFVVVVKRNIKKKLP